LFQGGETVDLVTQLKRDYAVVRHVKPQASRANSAELYVLATGFRGAPSTQA
jgi:23S rRNA (uridine2552-2'-O)-methyltransferase